MSTADLQKGMHEAGMGPAALVPVPSGTVLLPSPDAHLGQNLLIADRARKLAGSSVIVYWNDAAATVVPFAGAIGRGWAWGERDGQLKLGKQIKQNSGALDGMLTGTFLGWREKPSYREAAVAQFTKVLPNTDGTELKARIEDYRTGGLPAVTAAFGAFGLPDVAKVAELADEGRADLWLRQLAVPKAPSRKWFLWLVLAAVVVGVLVGLTGMPTIYGLLPLTVATAWFATHNVLKTRRPIRGKPVNAVLPVIPVTQGSAPTD